jgi:hypothetical protein
MSTKPLNKSQLNELARIDDSEWNILSTIFDNAIDLEVSNAIRYDIPAEQRAHACGRAEALQDLLIVLKSERQEAFVRLGRLDKKDE